MRKPLSSYHPVLYALSTVFHRTTRHLSQSFSRDTFATTIQKEHLPYRVYKHQSVLIRTLGDCDIALQRNKVTNIQLVLEKMNNIVIRPGETFSFCRLSGNPTKRKGYLDGILLANGDACQGIGGGICQVANLIHWLCLHSPLTITEHHHHGFDPFPDSGRVVPFGCGASIFYNYIDYQFQNRTPYSFQLVFWLDKKCINGDLRISSELPYKLHIIEREHKFIKYENQYFRTNEIWRTKNLKKGHGKIIEETLIQKNFSVTKYKPNNYTEITLKKDFDKLN